jgi:hypothetical protein
MKVSKFLLNLTQSEEQVISPIYINNNYCSNNIKIKCNFDSKERKTTQSIDSSPLYFYYHNCSGMR